MKRKILMRKTIVLMLSITFLINSCKAQAKKNLNNNSATELWNRFYDNMDKQDVLEKLESLYLTTGKKIEVSKYDKALELFTNKNSTILSVIDFFDPDFDLESYRKNSNIAFWLEYCSNLDFNTNYFSNYEDFIFDDFDAMYLTPKHSDFINYIANNDESMFLKMYDDFIRNLQGKELKPKYQNLKQKEIFLEKIKKEYEETKQRFSKPDYDSVIPYNYIPEYEECLSCKFSYYEETKQPIKKLEFYFYDNKLFGIRIEYNEDYISSFELKTIIEDKYGKPDQDYTIFLSFYASWNKDNIEIHINSGGASSIITVFSKSICNQAKKELKIDEETHNIIDNM